MLFEPTDLEVCTKPFQTAYWKRINFITPNLSELRQIATHLQIVSKKHYKNKFDEVGEICCKLVEYVDNIIVTLGVDGVIIARRGKATDSLLSVKQDKLEIRHYIGDKERKVVSVSGAGDNLASGIIAGMLEGLSEEESVSVGLHAAECAIASPFPVPELFGKNHSAWRSKAKYKTII